MSEHWRGTNHIGSKSYTCGYCGFVVASADGYLYDGKGAVRRVYICSHCKQPTYFRDQTQVPGVAPGAEVASVPDDIAKLYREARNCIAADSSTAAVLTCRKLLAHIAVSQGAPTGRNFLEYVEYLANAGFVPPNGKGWVDHIRKKGNEATHEIVIMSAADATELVVFAEMLLKFVYEFPSRVPRA